MRKGLFGLNNLMIVVLAAIILLLIAILLFGLINPASTSAINFGEQTSDVFN